MTSSRSEQPAVERMPFNPDRPRVHILGFDGMSPVLTERWMAEGHLPTFARLAREGTFRPLKTTIPPFSPTAWCTFMTGVNPGKHSVIDFLRRDPQRYLPSLGWWDVQFDVDPTGQRPPRVIIRNACKAPAFWRAAVQDGLAVNALRVPNTYPLDAVPGALTVTGFGTPVLQGGNSDFTILRTDLPEGATPLAVPASSGGLFIGVRVKDGVVDTELPALRHPVTREMIQFPVRLYVDKSRGQVAMEVQGVRHAAGVGEWSDWFQFKVAAGPIPEVWGMFHFVVVSIEPELWVHVGPIQLHPAKSLMTIAHPPELLPALVQEVGLFRTAGVADELQGILFGDLPPEIFLSDLWAYWRKEEQWFDVVTTRYPANLNIGVYTQTDHSQHSLFWTLDEKHPYYDPARAARLDNPLLKVYQHADGVLARTLDKIGPDATVLVVSDHGFAPFRRSISINTWLVKQGFLDAKLATMNRTGDLIPKGALFFRHVRWSQTKAYGMGLGIYLNLQGREGLGIVAPGEEAERILAEIKAGLLALVDPATGSHPITEVLDSRQIYHGPYASSGPDLLLGMAEGYRISWQSMIGGTEDEVFADEPGPYSGDHLNMMTAASAGIFFSNRKLAVDEPSIIDIAPTALAALGAPIPAEMDGRPLF